MSKERTDSSGRLLRDGEIQRADGRYEYRYMDKRGERRSVYSWRLNKTDRIPDGKRREESLREMEKRIQKELRKMRAKPMTEKRRDSSGRLLRDGEYQRADGRYEYRYTDKRGKRHSVYSWRLNTTDRIPAGKRCKEALREMEDRIQKDMANGIDFSRASSITMDAYFARYLRTHTKLKASTLELYSYNYFHYFQDYIGNMALNKLTAPQIVEVYTQILDKCNLSENSMMRLNVTLSAIMAAAVEDEIIAANPACKAYKIFKDRCEMRAPVEREALTVEQQRALFDFLLTSGTHGKNYPFYMFLLGTGCRVGEATGLTWDEVDFNRNVITIRHQLQHSSPRTGSGEPGVFRITKPKSAKGSREIPMFPEVKEALLMQQRIHPAEEIKIVVDGVSGFVFTTARGNLMRNSDVSMQLRGICKAFQQAETQRAALEHRDPIILPHITPHSLRHTFCTRLCESGTNVQTVQKIMGHADASTTLKVYSHVYEMQQANNFAEVLKTAKIM
jgi:integrase